MNAKCMIAVGLLTTWALGTTPAPALDFGANAFGTYYDADSAGDAWGGGALVRVGIFDWLAADGRISHLEISDTDLSVTPFEAAGLARLPLFKNTLVPYGGVGVGYYVYDDSDKANVDNGVGIFPLIGLDWRFGSSKTWSVFAEARWLILSEDLELPGDPSDEDIDGIAINLGVGFQF